MLNECVCESKQVRQTNQTRKARWTTGLRDLLCDRGGSCGVRLGANADAMTALVSGYPSVPKPVEQIETSSERCDFSQGEI